MAANQTLQSTATSAAAELFRWTDTVMLRHIKLCFITGILGVGTIFPVLAAVGYVRPWTEAIKVSTGLIQTRSTLRGRSERVRSCSL